MADNVEDVLEQQRAFVADASHQLRNPLAALLLRIELLALELPEGNEEIASVRTEGKRLAQVLDDLLDLALAEHAEADLRLTDIGALAAERVAAWRPVAESQGRTAGWAAARASHRLGRPGHAVQRPGRGDRQRGEVHARGRERRGDGRLRRRARRPSWSPTAAPVSTDEELARIGDRFWRSARHQNVKGSGLGLSISRALLAAGGGSIAYGHHEPHGLRGDRDGAADGARCRAPEAGRRRRRRGTVRLRLDRAVVAPGAVVQRQRVRVDRRAQVHQLRRVHLRADAVAAVDHRAGQPLGQPRVRVVRA